MNVTSPDISAKYKKWYNIKIFISSTFKDMDRERDILRLVVEPLLNNYFKQKHLHIMFVDLRKDVETDNTLSIEQREKQIFNICMKEIDDCSPYFIGLVGDRYGWIPPRYVLNTNLDILNSEKIIIGAPTEKSVTFFEFLKGIFVNGNVSSTALVYMRRSENEDDKNLLAFKSYLTRIFGGIQNINASNGALKEYCISDLSDENGRWAQAVFEDIKHIIISNLHMSDDMPFDLADMIDAEQEKFVFEKTKQFWGRSMELNHIETNINNSKDCFIVQKSPGIGASSLMCMAYLLCREKGHVCLFHSSQASENSSRGEEMLYRWCWQLEKELNCLNIDLLREIRYDIEALSDYLSLLISKISERNLKVVVFVDGMPMSSIPFFQRIHNMVILIQILENQNALNTEAYNLLLNSKVLILLEEIDSLTKDKLTEGQRHVVRRLLTRRNESGNPLWLSMACFITSRLTRQDYNSIRSRAELDNESKIDAYLETFVNQIPKDINNIALFWLEKLCEVYGNTYVDKYISLYSHSREGWTDEDVAVLIGGGLSKCISFRQSCGDLIFEQSESGLWKMRADIAELWRHTHNFDIVFFQTVKDYLSALSNDNSTRRMNLFCFARLCYDTDICKEVIIQETSPDPYDTPSLKDFIHLFYENHDEGLRLVTDIINKDIDMHELQTLYYWCTFLRPIGLVDDFMAVQGVFITKMTKIVGSDLTVFDQFWNEKYNILLDYADHYIEMNQAEMVVNIAEKCQKNLLEQILYNHDQQEEMQTSFFHWCCLYMDCIPTPQDRLVFANHIVNLVTSQKIKLRNMSKINFCVFLMYIADNLEEIGNFESGIDIILYGLEVNGELLKDLDASDIIRNESYDNYCIGVRNLCFFASQIENSLKKYKEQIKTAFLFAEKAMGTWTVNPISYYEVLLYYLQVNTDDEENMQLLDNALSKLGNDIAGTKVHELLPTLLMLYAYKEFYCTKTKNLDNYYIAYEDFEGYKRLYREIIQAHEADYEAAQIYHQYSAVLEGLQTNNSIKQQKEGVSCLEKCRRAIGEGKTQFKQIAQSLSGILDDLHHEDDFIDGAWRRNKMLLESLEGFPKGINANAIFDSTDNRKDLESENWYDKQECIISRALEKGDITSAEKSSDTLLQQVLENAKQNSALLGKAYYLAGIVQLQKNIWFKAYDRLEKSILAYEQNGTVLAPIYAYEKLADAYIKSQNIVEAKTLLNGAIHKFSDAGMPEKDILSLRTLLESISKETVADGIIDKEDKHVDDAETHTLRIWDKLISLFRL